MGRFGEFFKAQRMSTGLTLRAFCEKCGLDPSNTSKIERGLLPPPQGQRLSEYARLLKLKVASNEWYEFCDLAAAEAGRLPADLQDEDLAGKLPVFFRLLRESARTGGPNSHEALEDLCNRIKKA